MKILVVHSYKTADTCAKFQTFIKNFIKDFTQSSIQDHLDIVIKRKNDLEDYIVDYDSMQNIQGQQNDKNFEIQEGLFDKLDFVIIDGDPKCFMPWHTENDQIRLLVKNCIKANKCLFGTHILFNTLIYLKSLGMSKLTQKLLVVNNRQKGDFNMDRIQVKQFMNEQELKLNTERIPIILDSRKGQMYQYDGDNQLLVYYGDTSLVYKNHLLDKTTDYYGVQSVGSKVGFMIRDTKPDQIVVFKTTSSHSQAMQGVQEKFSINKNFIEDYSWKTNKIDGDISQLQIQPLLTTNQGVVLMAEHGNILASQFSKLHEYPKEPEFYKILKNFFKSKLLQMQESGFIHQKIRDTLTITTSLNTKSSTSLTQQTLNRKSLHQSSNSMFNMAGMYESQTRQTTSASNASFLMAQYQSRSNLNAQHTQPYQQEQLSRKILSIEFKNTPQKNHFGSLQPAHRTVTNGDHEYSSLSLGVNSQNQNLNDSISLKNLLTYSNQTSQQQNISNSLKADYSAKYIGSSAQIPNSKVQQQNLSGVGLKFNNLVHPQSSQNPYRNRVQSSYLNRRSQNLNPTQAGVSTNHNNVAYHKGLRNQEKLLGLLSQAQDKGLNKRNEAYQQYQQGIPTSSKRVNQSHIWFSSNDQKLEFSPGKSKHKRIESTVIVHEKQSVVNQLSRSYLDRSAEKNNKYQDDEDMNADSQWSTVKRLGIEQRMQKVARKVKKIKIIYQVPRKI